MKFHHVSNRMVADSRIGALSGRRWLLTFLPLCLLTVSLAGASNSQPVSDNAQKAEEESESRITVALLQILPHGTDQDANLLKAEEYCRLAAAMHADIALLPEMWNIGYTKFDSDAPEDVKNWQEQAIARDSVYVEHFVQLARELEIAIAVSYLERWDGAPRNSVTLIDRKGNKLLTYAKVHTCDFGLMESACTPGESFDVCELETANGSLKVGMMICYDREAPESARILMLNGAELILTPNACRLRPIFIDQFKIRAFENAVGVAMANYPAPQHNGHSSAFDADGELIVEAGDEEGIYLAPFNLKKIREHRAKTIWGNAFRRPHRYAPLTSFEKEPVFERLNGFKQPFSAKER